MPICYSLGDQSDFSMPLKGKKDGNCPYEVLGVPKTSTGEEIRRAYKQLALQHHPDKHPPEAKADAEAKFKMISVAYSILSDEQKRAKYDRTGSTEDDDGFEMGDFDDFLGSIFEQFGDFETMFCDLCQKQFQSEPVFMKHMEKHFSSFFPMPSFGPSGKRRSGAHRRAAARGKKAPPKAAGGKSAVAADKEAPANDEEGWEDGDSSYEDEEPDPRRPSPSRGRGGSRMPEMNMEEMMMGMMMAEMMFGGGGGGFAGGGGGRGKRGKKGRGRAASFDEEEEITEEDIRQFEAMMGGGGGNMMDEMMMAAMMAEMGGMPPGMMGGGGAGSGKRKKGRK